MKKYALAAVVALVALGAFAGTASAREAMTGSLRGVIVGSDTMASSSGSSQKSEPMITGSLRGQITGEHNMGDRGTSKNMNNGRMPCAGSSLGCRENG